MNARTIRRAIERKAQKHASKEAAKALTTTPGSLAEFTEDNALIEEAAEPHATPPLSISQARLNANRQNALHSTGPRTAQGKSVSSHNAVKTALTGRTVLLPTDDADRYQTNVQAFFKELSPNGHRETLLTQSLADIAWRVERIAGLEMAIYAQGRAGFADHHPDEPAALRTHLIELDIYQENESTLRNLHLQEARLRRQRDRDNKELRQLQAERRAAIRQQLEMLAQAHKQAQNDNQPFDPADLGFDFSINEMQRFLSAPPPALPTLKRPKAA